MSPLTPDPGKVAHELSLTRLIDAPRTKVFRAWTEPALLSQWWGPHGMTTPLCEMQLWAGGLFRTVMSAPDGTEYPSQGVFLGSLPPSALSLPMPSGRGGCHRPRPS